MKRKVLTLLTAAALLCSACTPLLAGAEPADAGDSRELPVTAEPATGDAPAAEASPATENSPATDAAPATDIASGSTKTSYLTYAASLTGKPDATDRVTVSGEAGRVLEGEATVREEAACEGGSALATYEGAVVVYDVTVPADGLYTLSLTVSTESAKRSTAQRALYIDGAMPFAELSELSFTRSWADVLPESGSYALDKNGNELRPDVEAVVEWQVQRLDAASGTPYRFWLTAGSHTLQLTATKELLVIDCLTLAPADTVKSYAEVLQEWQAAGYTFRDSSQDIFLEAEKSLAKSDYSIYPKSDRTSALSSPQSTAGLTLNSIGNTNWQTVGQWIAWEVKVEEEGLYYLSVRFKQSALRGVFVSRELTIDGELPFAEAAAIRFPYSNTWQRQLLSDSSGQPYAFYLSAGTHTLRMRVVQGELYELVGQVSAALTELNSIYRSILSITGTSPDVNRDYNFDTTIPAVLENMAAQAVVLREAAEQLVQLTGQTGQMVSTLETLYTQLDYMTERPYRIAKQFKTFKSNISALGDWVNSMSNQPLLLDSLSFQSDQTPLPRANANFLESLRFNVSLFLHSFTADYTAQYADSDPLVVWVPTGRDQWQIISTLADNDFSVNTGISVAVRLVAPTALLPSTLAGSGPDVALSNAQHVPVDYALRNAVMDLNRFEDLAEIQQRFAPSAMTPMTFNGTVYGLPENQTWPMLFVRNDVFGELGLTVPTTWDEVVELLPTLARQNLDFGMTVGYSGFLQLLYQNGGSLYQEDGYHTALGSNESIAAFYRLCNLFTQHKLPIEYDAANRFRSGEMPLIMADYAFYNQLMVFAPEISGQWEMVPVPGTVREDGTVDNTVVATATAAVIMKNTRHEQEAWEFLKWWTSTETQVSFGTNMEAVLGPSAKQPTANLEAAGLLPWSVKEYQSLQTQRDDSVGIPIVPGYYQAERLIGFAFNDVYNGNLDPREELQDCLHSIDTELLRKHNEFLQQIQ